MSEYSKIHSCHCIFESSKAVRCSFYEKKDLIRKTPPVPSLFRLMIFRTGRSGFQHADVKYYDYYYFKEKGWFESDYYYDISLGPIKKLFGRFFDFLGQQVAKHM